MAYKIIVSPRAQREIENAIDYYALYSDSAPASFIGSLKETYALLEHNPFFSVRYNNVRSIKLRRFPHSLFFTVNEPDTVRILSCFHHFRTPNNRPQS